MSPRKKRFTNILLSHFEREKEWVILKGHKDFDLELSFADKQKYIFGASFSDVKNHFENLFDGELNWWNYNYTWNIDHIKPKAVCPLYPSEDEILSYTNYKNLRPLKKDKNLEKGNIYKGKKYFLGYPYKDSDFLSEDKSLFFVSKKILLKYERKYQPKKPFVKMSLPKLCENIPETLLAMGLNEDGIKTNINLLMRKNPFGLNFKLEDEMLIVWQDRKKRNETEMV